MKKYRIAYFGIFDIENYGDHLYPIIFKHEMEKRGLDFEIVYFSNYACDNTFSVNAHIHKYDEIDDMHKDNPFDAVIIGGGSLIHPYKLTQILAIEGEKKEVEYPMLNIWLYPLIFCYNNDIKCVINSVGVPYPLLGDSPVISDLFDCCDYISVRNEQSFDIFSKTGTKCPIINIPDSVFGISDTFTLDDVRENKKILNLPDNYVVFQCGKGISDDYKKELRSLFEKINSLEYTICLLPIAYTNDDDDFLRNLSNDYPDLLFKKFDTKLNVLDIASVISNAKIYIGLSMHGAITALSFGVPTISFDYYRQDKIKQLYEKLNCPALIINNPKNIIKILENSSYGNFDIINPKIDEYRKELSIHYDKIYNIINNPKEIKDFKLFNNQIKLYESLFIQEELKNQRKYQDSICKQEKELELIQIKKTLQEQSEKLFVREDELKHVKAMLEERDELINDCKTNIQNCNETIEQLKNINSDLNNNYNNLIMQMGYLQNERDALESFRVEVINSKMFKLFHLFDKNAQ